MARIFILGAGTPTPTPERFGSSQVLQLGDEVLVTVMQGSLITGRPRDDRERTDALADYFRENRDLFGAGGVAATELSFTEAMPQDPITNGAGETYVLLALNQMHMGAPVIDEFQMAAFMTGPDGSELRRVRGHLRYPSGLPTPPDADAVTRDHVLPLARSLIEIGRAHV